jgi:hypothetical protein
MKKTIAGTALLFGLSISAQAQIAAGTILTGGSIGYSQTQDKGSVGNTSSQEILLKNRQFDLSPKAAYFVVKNLALGLSLQYSVNLSTQYQFILMVPVSGTTTPVVVRDGETEQRRHSISIGPMARYYLFVGNKAAFFGQLGLGYLNSRTEETVSSLFLRPNAQGSTYNASGYYSQFTPGLAYFLSDKFALELAVTGFSYYHIGGEATYRYQNTLPASTTATYTDAGFAADFGLSSLQLGASIYLGRK